MPEQKLTPEARRELTLRALRGENKTHLAEEYGIARSYVYVLVEEAMDEPHEKLRAVRREIAFRQGVLHLLERGREG